MENLQALIRLIGPYETKINKLEQTLNNKDKIIMQLKNELNQAQEIFKKIKQQTELISSIQWSRSQTPLKISTNSAQNISSGQTQQKDNHKISNNHRSTSLDKLLINLENTHKNNLNSSQKISPQTIKPKQQNLRENIKLVDISNNGNKQQEINKKNRLAPGVALTSIGYFDLTIENSKEYNTKIHNKNSSRQISPNSSMINGVEYIKVSSVKKNQSNQSSSNTTKNQNNNQATTNNKKQNSPQIPNIKPFSPRFSPIQQNLSTKKESDQHLISKKSEENILNQRNINKSPVNIKVQSIQTQKNVQNQSQVQTENKNQNLFVSKPPKEQISESQQNHQKKIEINNIKPKSSSQNNEINGEKNKETKLIENINTPKQTNISPIPKSQEISNQSGQIPQKENNNDQTQDQNGNVQKQENMNQQEKDIEINIQNVNINVIQTQEIILKYPDVKILNAGQINENTIIKNNDQVYIFSQDKKISKIKISQGECLKAIQFSYRNILSLEIPGEEFICSEVQEANNITYELEIDEYIIEVFGKYTLCIDHIGFITSKGRILQGGNSAQQKGQSFIWKIPEKYHFNQFDIGLDQQKHITYIQSEPEPIPDNSQILAMIQQNVNNEQVNVQNQLKENLKKNNETSEESNSDDEIDEVEIPKEIEPAKQRPSIIWIEKRKSFLGQGNQILQGSNQTPEIQQDIIIDQQQLNALNNNQIHQQLIQQEKLLVDSLKNNQKTDQMNKNEKPNVNNNMDQKKLENKEEANIQRKSLNNQTPEKNFLNQQESQIPQVQILDSQVSQQEVGNTKIIQIKKVESSNNLESHQKDQSNQEKNIQDNNQNSQIYMQNRQSILNEQEEQQLPQNQIHQKKILNNSENQNSQNNQQKQNNQEQSVQPNITQNEIQLNNVQVSQENSNNKNQEGKQSTSDLKQQLFEKKSTQQSQAENKPSELKVQTHQTSDTNSNANQSFRQKLQEKKKQQEQQQSNTQQKLNSIQENQSSDSNSQLNTTQISEQKSTENLNTNRRTSQDQQQNSAQNDKQLGQQSEENSQSNQNLQKKLIDKKQQQQVEQTQNTTSQEDIKSETKNNNDSLRQRLLEKKQQSQAQENNIETAKQDSKLKSEENKSKLKNQENQQQTKGQEESKQENIQSQGNTQGQLERLKQEYKEILNETEQVKQQSFSGIAIFSEVIQKIQEQPLEISRMERMGIKKIFTVNQPNEEAVLIMQMFVYLLNNDENIIEKEVQQIKQSLHYLDTNFKALNLETQLTIDKYVFIQANLELYNDTLVADIIKNKLKSTGLSKMFTWLQNLTNINQNQNPHQLILDNINKLIVKKKDILSLEKS